MTWFQAKKRIAPSTVTDRFASSIEVDVAFEAQKDYLHWIALLITGNSAKASTSVVNAWMVSVAGRGVFREWLERWVRFATVRAAVQQVHEAVANGSALYAGWSCSHAIHEEISDEEVAFLQETDPQLIISQLDAFSRTILVLKGIHHVSISDCAVQLEVTRRCVVGGYCRTLQWIRKLDRTSIGREAGSAIKCVPADAAEE